MNKMFRILAIYSGFVWTLIDKLIRQIITKHIYSSDKVDEFVTSNGLNNQSPALCVADAIRKNFVWREDKLDYAKCPEAFLYDGKDDCDGFALFVETILLKAGFQDVFRLYVKASSDRGHVVCVAKFSDGMYWQLGNWQAFQFSSSDMKDMAKVIAMKMEGAVSYAMKFKGKSYCEYYEGE